MERGLNGQEQPKKTMFIEEEPDKKYKNASEIFREVFPMYLAEGMTYAEFWEGESWLVIAYRKAKKYKQNEVNYSAWLSAVYVLRALQTGIPVVLNGVAKTRIELPEFPDQPIDFEQKSKEQREAKQMELQKAKMKEMVERFNATFKRKHEKDRVK